MNIVVLAGGLSTERQVSLTSGAQVCKSLKKSGHNAVLIDAFFGVENLPSDIYDIFKTEVLPLDQKVSTEEPDLKKIRAQRKDSGFGTVGKNIIEICKAADIVYMGLHGENGENGRMQAFFDILEIKYTGCDYLSSALAMNKEIAKNIFNANGIPCPKGIAVKKGAQYSFEGMSAPYIVKPCSGGSSIGLYIANNEKELYDSLNAAFEYEDEVLVEEFIKGREFSVGVLGDSPLPPIEIIPKGGVYDYAHKYQAGWTEEVCPADITKDECELLQSLALKVYNALGLKVYSRMDFLLTAEGKAYCLEANTLPGMTPTSLIPQEAAAAGISYDELCLKVIDLSMKKYGN